MLAVPPPRTLVPGKQPVTPVKPGPPTPLKAVLRHSSVNFRMGSGSIQTKADYSKPVPRPVTTVNLHNVSRPVAQDGGWGPGSHSGVLGLHGYS